MAFSGWSSTASLNTSVGGLNLDGNVQTVSNLDNIVRGEMAELATARDDGTISNVAPRGYLYGLTLSNNVGDATNDIDIAVGECSADTSPYWKMVLASALTKRLDANWAVGTNQGGLDTGAIANTTYHMWLIQRSDTAVVDVLFSTSASAPTMPASYDRKRRIGAIVRIAGVIKPFIQDNDDFSWVTPQADVNTVNPGASAVTRATTVPSGIRVKGKYIVGFTATAAGDNPGAIYLSDLSVTDQPVTAAICSFETFTAAAGTAAGAAQVEVYTNTSAQIRTRLSLSGAGTTFLVTTMGYKDTRGRV